MGTIVSTGQITIVDSNDGLTASLSSSSAVLPADSVGVVTSYTGAETTMKIMEGGADTTSLWAFSVTATGGGISYRDSDDVADKTGVGGVAGGLGGVNMHSNSQAIDAATWAKTSLPVTTDSLIAPDGTATAETVNNSPGLTSTLLESVALALNTQYTESLYVKPLSANKVVVMTQFDGSVTLACTFNLSTMSAGVGGLIETSTDGWYRISYTYITGATGSPSSRDTYFGAYGSTPSSVSFGVWGAQLTAGSVAGEYKASSTTARSGTPGYLYITSLTQSLSYLDITAVQGTSSITRRYSVARAVQGTVGTRGTRQLYKTDPAYTASYGAASYASAATAAIASAVTGTIPTTPLVGDTVVFTNGTSYTTTYTCTIPGASPTWALPGTVIDGSLLVTGTVTTTKLVAGLLDGFSLRVGTSTTGVTIAGATAVTNAAGNSITNGTYVYQNSTTLYGMYARNFGAGGSAYFESGGGVTIDCFHNTTISGAAGSFRSNSTDTGAVGLYAIGYHGARISNTGSTQVGLIGTALGKCFYAQAGTFGPFTGAHDALLLRGSDVAIGDICVDYALQARKGISDTLFEVRRSTEANQKGPVGVLCELTPEWSGFIPAALISRYADVRSGQTSMSEPVAVDGYASLVAKYALATVNAVGEGQINVCNLGGNLLVGDLIVTSSKPGKGMRQRDDILRSTTVAKVRENVTFSGPDDVRLVACIYLCG